MSLCALLLFALSALGRGVPAYAGSQYVQEPQLDACGQWNDAVHALEQGRLDGRAARETFRGLWKTIIVDDLASPKENHWQWMFPLPGYDTGCFGESYDTDDYRFLDGPAARGYPGLRLYIRDAGRLGLEDRTGKAQPVVSASDGVVVAAEKFWKQGDPCPWGDYVMVLDQQDRLFFLYGDLGSIRVSPGQLVLKGEVVGWLGRTGKDVEAERLGTQLRFEVHTFDDGLFYPVYPGRALRVAGHTEWPIPDGIVRPRFKAPKTPPVQPY
ncbi:MAG TPA: M23 family metallopeptidase [bacterium]|nr:M23 family metallopeptidase [bacterium]